MTPSAHSDGILHSELLHRIRGQQGGFRCPRAAGCSLSDGLHGPLRYIIDRYVRYILGRYVRCIIDRYHWLHHQPLHPLHHPPLRPLHTDGYIRC